MRLGALVWMAKPSDPKQKVRPALVVYVGDDIVGLSFGTTLGRAATQRCEALKGGPRGDL